MEWETLGRSTEVVEVLERLNIPIDQLSLSTEGMQLVLERPPMSEISKETGEVVTTTSIPPLSQPLAADAVRIEYEKLPTDDLRGLVAPTDLLWSIPARENVLYLASRPGRPTLLFGTACSVLTSVDLPDDWEGICLEMTVNGTPQAGVFTYDEAVAAAG